ncbi:MAG: glycosyltransferase family 1 protein [Patescibacteria group bacterium]
MKILVDIRHLTNPQPSGVGGYTKALLDAIFHLDQKNEYVLFASGAPKTLRRLPKFDAPNVRLLTIPIPNKIINSSIALSGRPYLEDLLPKVNRPDAWFFPNLNYIATKLPYVVTAHDLSFRIFPEFFSARMRLWHRLINPKRVFSRARAILAPSNSTKQDLVELYGVNEKRIHVTPLGISNALQSGTDQAMKVAKKFGRYVLSVATIEPRKNHLSLIEAYEMYRDRTGDEITLVIAGATGWKAQPVLEAIKKSRYAHGIHLLDYVSEEQKIELYKRATLFVFPSFYEGFGLPVLDAMSHGLPIITSHTSSMPELVGDAGILIDPFNVNDLFVAIREVMHSKTLQAELKTRGLKRAKDFSWNKTAKQTLDVFGELSF